MTKQVRGSILLLQGKNQTEAKQRLILYSSYFKMGKLLHGKYIERKNNKESKAVFAID